VVCKEEDKKRDCAFVGTFGSLLVMVKPAPIVANM